MCKTSRHLGAYKLQKKNEIVEIQIYQINPHSLIGWHGHEQNGCFEQGHLKETWDNKKRLILKVKFSFLSNTNHRAFFFKSRQKIILV